MFALKHPSVKKRWIARFMGAALLAAALFVSLSLVSYNAADPSFNRAAEGEASNWAGMPGAYIADSLLQFLGMASVLVVVFSTIYGFRCLIKPGISLWWLRFIMILPCLIAASGIFALIETPEQWSYFISLGGFIGEYIKTEALTYVTKLPYLAITSAILVVSFFLASGLTASEWVSSINTILRGCAKIYRSIAMVANAFYQCARFVKGKITRRKEEAWEDEFLATTPSGEQEPVKKQEPKTLSELTQSLRKKPAPPPPLPRQATLPLSINGFDLPSLALLSPVSEKQKKNVVSESALAQNARLLEKVLEDFGVNGKIINISPGPVVTLYELEPAAGTKSSRIIGLADDIARSMCATSTRIAVIPGRNAIGIELPNSNREIVYLREILEGDDFKDENYKLPVALGKNIAGDSIVVDLSRMPHLLVAGTTGSGKSVAINTMILSFLYRMTPEQCKFIMIDPKMLELSVYDGIPHLLAPVVTDPGKAVVALKWTTKEMENRYRLMSNLGVRNIASYNKRIEEALAKGETLERTVQTGFDPETGKPIIEKVPFGMTPLPFIVVVVDEMADLMLVAGKDIESSIQRLAQMARAAGIHIIMATQRPSVDVITGVIKANFPTRISFQVTSRIDSRTILGEQGAEQLLGMGDMLYMAGGGRVSRVHGPFVDDKEVEKVVSFLKTQSAPSYITAITEDDDENGSYIADGSAGGEADEMYDEAVIIVTRDRKASTSYIQRCLKIGYNRAATIIERMEKEGVVSRANHAGKREVLAPDSEDN
jgi:DNA segregation ATPase FtsK/SpoIIIE, S-DNA-T family